MTDSDTGEAPAVPAPPHRLPARLDPAVRAIAHRWRRLTGGGAPTLIACSGGADSSALALALSAAGADLTLAYARHAMREPAITEREARGVAALAHYLGAAFERIELHGGDAATESAAREARYAALLACAEQRGTRFIATGHHRDDQLETMLMALIRGSGPSGLAGMEESRTLGEAVHLIRPMLGVGRADAERLCDRCGWAYFQDHTNLETHRLRAALRHGPIAQLLALRPGAAEHAASAAILLRDAAELLRERAEWSFGYTKQGGWGRRWERERLRRERVAVIGEGLRFAVLEETVGAYADRLGWKLLGPAIDAIRSSSTDPREFDWPAGLRLRVTAHDVELLPGDTEGTGL